MPDLAQRRRPAPAVAPAPVQQPAAPVSGSNREAQAGLAGAEDVGPGGPVAAVVRRVSPLLGDLLDHGLVGALGPDLGAGIDAFVQRGLAEIDLGPLEPALATFATGTGLLVGVATGDTGCCQVFRGWIDGLAEGALLAPGLPETAEGLAGLAPNLEALARLGGDPVAALLGEVAPALGVVLEEVVGAVACCAASTPARRVRLAERLGVPPEASVAALLAALWDGVAGAAVATFDDVLAAFFSLPGPSRLPRGRRHRRRGRAARWLSANWGDPDALARARAWPTTCCRASSWARSVRRTLGAFAEQLGAAALLLRDRLDAALQPMLGLPVLATVAALLGRFRDAVDWVATSPLWGDLGAVVAGFGRFSVDIAVNLAETLSALIGSFGVPPVVLSVLASQALEGAARLLPGAHLRRAAPRHRDGVGRRGPRRRHHGARPGGGGGVPPGGARRARRALDHSVADKAAIGAIAGLLARGRCWSCASASRQGTVSGTLGAVWDVFAGLWALQGTVWSALLGIATGLFLAPWQAVDALGDRVFEQDAD
ncbi:MAG: hypothetical protein R3F59_30745 [Myxococcota bacterium]